MKITTCCGAVIYRLTEGSKEYLLIKAKNGGHWDFPKGHMEAGETEIETALREVKEETGLSVSLIPGFRESISYVDTVKHKYKTVVFFLAVINSQEVKIQESEIVDFEWLNYDDALERLTYQNSKEAFRKMLHPQK